MSLIAHLTDLHLVEERPERRTLADRARLGYLSLGRPSIHSDASSERPLRSLRRASYAPITW